MTTTQQQRVTVDASDDFLYHYQQAASLLNQGHFEEAHTEANKALEIKPDNQRCLDLLSQISYKLGRFTESERVYSKLVDQSPSDPTLRINLALTRIKQGNFRGAIEQLEMALRLSGDQKRIQMYLGVAWQNLQDFQRAREHYLIAGMAKQATEMEDRLKAAREVMEPGEEVRRSTSELAAVKSVTLMHHALPLDAEAESTGAPAPSEAQASPAPPAPAGAPAGEPAPAAETAPAPEAAPATAGGESSVPVAEAPPPETVSPGGPAAETAVPGDDLIIDDSTAAPEVAPAPVGDIAHRVTMEIPRPPELEAGAAQPAAKRTTDLQLPALAGPAADASAEQGAAMTVLSVADFAAASELPMSEPDRLFGLQPGFLVMNVKTGVFLRAGQLSCYRGALTFQVVKRKARGKTLEEGFGTDLDAMYRATGTGQAIMRRDKAQIHIFEMSGGGAYFKEECVAAFAESLVWENGRIPSKISEPLHMTVFGGSGEVCVRTRGPLMALKAQGPQKVRVRVADLVGWSGDLLPKILRADGVEFANGPEGLEVEFGGTGYILVDNTPVEKALAVVAQALEPPAKDAPSKGQEKPQPAQSAVLPPVNPEEDFI